MKTASLHSQTYRRDLGGGLVLRWSTAADRDRLNQLYSYVFRDKADDPPNQVLPHWIGDLMSGRHPLLGPGDFALVEDTDREQIVTATCLLEQTWEYAGIPFAVGRPEVVATHPEYRNRGLVRAVFELIHARSAAFGHLAQGITGIYYYYRQFGYEYALDLGGSRSTYFAAIPQLKEGEAEPYSLRNATLDDLPRIMALYDHDRARVAISARHDEAVWRWLIDGQSSSSLENWHTQLILDSSGQIQGYALVGRRRWEDVVPIFGLTVAPGVSLAAVLPSVLRALQSQAPDIPAPDPKTPPASRISFILGRDHPVYDVLGEKLTHQRRPLYAWYVRVPDLPAFLRHITPALEQRLANSSLAGHSGEVRLDFYRGGLRMVFADGRLMTVEDWQVDHNWGPRGQAGFPPLVFLQLLFGRRSLAELRHAFPDVWADDEVYPLLEALFPPQPAWALPLD
jgi:hypothetical protein